MLDALRKAIDLVTAQLKDADPDSLRATDAVEVMTAYAELERLGAAGRLLFSHRAAESVRWKEQGHTSAASWMAELSGTGIGDAERS